MKKKSTATFNKVSREWFGWLEWMGINRQGEGILYLIVMLSVTGAVAWGWFALGPGDPAYALLVAGWTFSLGPGVTFPVMQLLPHQWFRVPADERVLHRILGVGILGWLLDRTGWNRYVAEPLRKFDRTKAGLVSLELAVRAGATAHGTCFTIHLLLGAVALFTGHPWGSLWILLGGVVVHFYPMLLQRSVLLRVQTLLDKSGA